MNKECLNATVDVEHRILLIRGQNVILAAGTEIFNIAKCDLKAGAGPA